MAFGSDASDLVPGDTNGHQDVFVHDRWPLTLTVKSAPVSGVTITGDKPGTTDYTAMCFDEEVVNLTAPAAVSFGGKNYTFDRWYIDGQPQTGGQVELQLIMDADHTVLAQYDWRLSGDVTDDCKVDILDMIFVRNNTGDQCEDGGGPVCPTTPALQDFTAPENPFGSEDVVLTVQPRAMEGPDVSPDEVNVYLNGNLIGHLVIDTAAGDEVGFDLGPSDNVVTLEYAAGGYNNCAIFRAAFSYLGGSVANPSVWIGPGGSTSCTITAQQ